MKDLIHRLHSDDQVISYPDDRSFVKLRLVKKRHVFITKQGDTYTVGVRDPVPNLTLEEVVHELLRRQQLLRS